MLRSGDPAKNYPPDANAHEMERIPRNVPYKSPQMD